MKKTSILFVCLGNICRSPIAEGVFRALLAERECSDKFRVDSAGTSGYHEGELPDPRSIQICEKYGLDLTEQRSRAIRASDYHEFDWIVAMDRSNFSDLNRRSPSNSEARIVRLLDFSSVHSGDVPDPYYGGKDGFENVYQMVREALGPFLEEVLTESN